MTKTPPLFLTYIVFGLGILTSVWVLQYGFGFLPCPLCYYQRYPWWLMLFLGLFSCLLNIVYRQRDSHRFFILTLGVFVMLFSMMLAAYHAGVEWQFWPGPKSCSSVNMLDPMAKSVDDFFNAANVVSCNKPAVVFLGLSLSGWNFVASTLVAIYLLTLLFAKKR
ncbi:MAG: disulfide bond formation protein B [Hydrotalea sp.]|nr:disulfide bond formation protein B [Hydrotalea sp.]